MRLLIILTCLYLSPVILGNDEKNETTFVATHEWQVVKKGTPIPKGLHVRHNFQTGVTEAKLIDNEDIEEKESSEKSHSNSLALHPEKTIPEDLDPPVFSEKSNLFDYPLEELKARLKKIKQDEPESPPELIKQKFRDYETLKKELKALEINITTDSELLGNYFQKFQNHKNAITMGTLMPLEVEEVLDILYNLEYLLHHIDNAKVFTDMQGMVKIISPCLNGTNNEIKAEALRLLGTAVQSNPKVQLKALENDFVQKLLHILSTNTQIEVRSRCLFALSALIRQFPAAQKVWINHGGLEIFGKILVHDQLQIQMKVMKLISDLIIERQDLQEVANTEQSQLKTKAYLSVDLEQKILTNEYCKHLGNLMTKSFKDEIGNQFKASNYEFLETISESMITIFPVCKYEFKSSEDSLLHTIQHLLSFYQNLNTNLEQNDNDILKNLTLLIQKLQAPHDEL
ncbi:Nucleotide exchange factor SIL1 [Dufourea novaeangliae]|uniref:Nucleotide exchange factor SIL1 n=1 Tax=Dufourea novaeangliae TaxID=178035 RepID=A0A154PGP7_DUFNO|nr:Nucleotide exchange factor SIL1 [Dufourea novaeangliae]